MGWLPPFPVLEFIIDVVVLYLLQLTELLDPEPEPEVEEPEVPSSVVWLDTDELEDKEFLLFFRCKIAVEADVAGVIWDRWRPETPGGLQISKKKNGYLSK